VSLGAARIWLIAGATASGKSALALRLAAVHGAEIVNADSMQLYADLSILTARPSAEDEARARHHLYGIADAGEAWSVGRWLDAALAAIAEIAARGAPAIVVGGTGLYFRALTRGLAAVPPIAAAARDEAQALYDEIGEAAFRARLAAVDPAAAARINAADRQRLTRAFEVWLATGRALSDWHGATTPHLPARAWRGLVLDPPREALRRRCAARLEAMVAQGALGEVRALMARGLAPSLPAMKAVGLRPLAAHLAGETTLAEALERAAAQTRRFAKRQITWVRHQAPDWPRLAEGGPRGARAAAEALVASGR